MYLGIGHIPTMFFPSFKIQTSNCLCSTDNLILDEKNTGIWGDTVV